MSDLETVLQGFVGWLEKRNGDAFYVVTKSSSGGIILTLAAADDFVVGVAVHDKSLILAAANPEVSGVELKTNLGSKFRNPEALGVEIAKHLLSFAAEAHRTENLEFERQLAEAAAEMALSVGSDLYSGFALMTLAIHFKDVLGSSLHAFYLASAAFEAMQREDNDELLAMTTAVREQCWEAFQPTYDEISDFRQGMKEEFIAEAPSSSAEKVAELSGLYMKAIVPPLTFETEELSSGETLILKVGVEDCELVSGGLSQDHIWELMVPDYSEEGIGWSTPSPSIADSHNPDEVAFGFLLSLVLGGLDNLPTSDGVDVETRTRIEEIFQTSGSSLVKTVVLVAMEQAVMGMALIGLLKIADEWEKLPQWFEEPLLSEAINSYAEFFEYSYFLDTIFELAVAARFGYEPQG